MTIDCLKHLRQLLTCKTPPSHGEQSAGRQNKEQRHIKFLDLPPEIMLNIAKQLGRRDVVVLSLTCKSLYTTISFDYNISLSFQYESSEVRAQVLRLFEHKWPSRLVCRRCGCLFDWRRRQRDPAYLMICPNFLRHTEIENSRNDTFAYVDEKLYVTREIIDLILRRHRRGLFYGIPPNVLDADREGWYGVHRRIKARFIKGDLFFLCHLQVKVLDRKEEVERLGVLERSLCLHMKTRLRKQIWENVWRFAASAGPAVKEQVTLEKCRYCATDAKLYIRRWPENKLMVELRIWRNFGNGEDGVQMAEQMFQSNTDILTKITDDVLSQRDLQADFESR